VLGEDELGPIDGQAGLCRPIRCSLYGAVQPSRRS